MIKYRVKVVYDHDDILEHIRNRDNPDYKLIQGREFDDLYEAQTWAVFLSLKIGKPCRVDTIDPDQYTSMRSKIKHILGAE